MPELIDFLAELKELQALYNSGDLRNFDFDTRIQQYERDVARFERDMEQEYAFFRNKMLDFG